jgi:endoglycosylceramidase
LDGGASDGGTSDGGTSDGGTSDGGTSDGGTSDSGASDGTSDGGTSDGDAVTPGQAPVGHAGRWLIDARGRVLVVHGLNIVNKLPPYTAQALGFDDDDAAFLQANGFNAVRLGVLWRAVEPQPGAYDAAYVAQIRQTEQMLASHGIYTLVDWHQDEYAEAFGGEGFPPWAIDTGGLTPASPPYAFPNEYSNDPAEKAAWDNLYQDKPGPGGVGLQQRLAAAEAYVAGQLAADPWVLGYDLVNEPSGGNYPEPIADISAIGPLESKLLRSVRAADGQHLVFYEPTSTFALAGNSLPNFGDPKAGMSYHDYCFEPGSTSQAEYTALCGGVLNGAQTSAVSRSNSTGDAILLTEFGSAAPWAEQIVADDADANMMPWLKWAYCGCGDPTTAIDPGKEGIVLDPTQPPAGSNVNGADLSVLVRPYPQAVAGTPTSWSYDASTGAFSLAYGTAPPPGVSLVAGADTVVFVPSIQYPNGYTVTVTGGSVASGSGTQNLVIAADAGASSVRVTFARK